MNALALLVLLAGPAAAGPAAATKAAAQESSFIWLVGASYGAPQKLTGGIGFWVPIVGGDRPLTLMFSGDAQAGMAGAGLRLGLDVWPSPSSNVFLVSVHAVAAHTWGDPLGTEPGRTLLGGDVEVSLARLLWASAGLLAPVGGSGSTKTVTTWSVGVRFPIKCFTGCQF